MKPAYAQKHGRAFFILRRRRLNPRVRRWSSPRAALVIPACGVGHPRVRRFNFRLRRFMTCNKKREHCCSLNFEFSILNFVLPLEGELEEALIRCPAPS